MASAPYPCAQRLAQALSDVLVISVPGDSWLPGPQKIFEELIEQGSVKALAFLAHRFFFYFLFCVFKRSGVESPVPYLWKCSFSLLRIKHR